MKHNRDDDIFSKTILGKLKKKKLRIYLQKIWKQCEKNKFRGFGAKYEEKCEILGFIANFKTKCEKWKF